MLLTVELKNFRKHEARTFTFTDGLNVVRGANENGKSTLLESILYALFGSKVLRDSLADVVTWGKKESELKVILTLAIEGRLYSISRGKSGAECLYDGGMVTGQTEVSNFAAELLGADANTASKLMMASQTSIRGALEEGPKAISMLIENLADFDLFNRLGEAFDTKLTTGPTASLEDKVRTAEETLSNVILVEPDTASIDAEVGVIQGSIDIKGKVALGLQIKKQEANVAYQGAYNQKRTHDMLQGNLEKATDNYKVHVEQKKAAEAKAVLIQSPSAMEDARFELNNCQNHARRLKIWQAMTDLKYPEAFWEGTKEAFQSELASSFKRYNDTKVESDRFSRQAIQYAKDGDAARKLICNDTTCPTCKQELKNKSAIIERNVTQDEISKSCFLAAEKCLADAEALRKYLIENDDHEDLQRIQALAQKFESFAIQNGEFVEPDLNFYPPKLNWKGVVPEALSQSEAVLRKKLADLQHEKEEAEKASAMVTVLTQTLVEDLDYIERIQGQLKDCPLPEGLEALQNEERRIGNQICGIELEIQNNTNEIRELEQQKQNLFTEYRLKVQQREQAEVNLKKAKEELSELQDNNALVKKVRAARPIIGDKLWATCLASVSEMFSTMRGERSLVSKGRDGFSVNGKPVSSLSGSTLDLLGLSIRVALCKMFLPHVSFLTLDEPGSACDDGRVEQMLGFIATSGFKQVLIVSHESATESIADNLITLD